MNARIQTRTVHRSDETAMSQYAQMLSDWLYEKNVNPMEQIRKAEIIFCAFVDAPIGFTSVNRFGSPDYVDDGALWFEDTVVHPAWRSKGVGKLLQTERMKFIHGKPNERVFTSAIHPRRCEYLLRQGWMKVRDTYDGTTPTTVFELPRNRIVS